MKHRLNYRNQLITLPDVQELLCRANINLMPSNLTLYRQAFTHKSYMIKGNHAIVHDDCYVPLQPHNYESLEFYGDSIVCAATVEYLYHRYNDNLSEGELTKLKNKIVSSPYLAHFSRCLSIGKFMLLSEYMENMYGRDLDRFLEDCFESFVAAISLDISYSAAMRFIVYCIDNFVDFAHLLHFDSNYKDIILNYFQLQGWSHPQYTVDTELGPQRHKSFIVNVIRSTPSYEVIAQGIGKTKKLAEMNASFNALKQLGRIH